MAHDHTSSPARVIAAARRFVLVLAPDARAKRPEPVRWAGLVWPFAVEVAHDGVAARSPRLVVTGVRAGMEAPPGRFSPAD